VERNDKIKLHFLNVLRFIEPTIADFWVDRAHGQDFLAFKSASGFSHRVGIVGEGILNIFRLCDSVINLKEGETLLVDEPELSLHPQSQRRLYRLLAKRAEDRQVIVSTHSVHFVDWEHLRFGSKIYRANISPEIGSTFRSLSAGTIDTITRIADLDIRNRRAFDVLAKEIFFSRGCVLVEGYEDAHLLQKHFTEISKGIIEIFGYGSGGADGIIAWLTACADLQIPAVGLFDGDAKGNAAIATARKRFEYIETIKVLQIPAPDIRDKHKLAADCRTETQEIEKEGVFTRNWLLKDQYRDSMAALVSEIASFLQASDDIPSLTPPT
jgi:predicted ATP-dependent endonuclease of OLD family